MDNPNSVQVVIQFAIVLVIYPISKVQLIFVKIRGLSSLYYSGQEK